MRDQAAIIRHDQTLTAEQKAAKLKELRASTREQMKSVLTPAQQQTFADRRAARKAHFAAKLGLTRGSADQIEELFQSNSPAAPGRADQPSLTNEQKQAQLSQIRQSSQAQLATILTPEQLVKFQQMRRKRRSREAGLNRQSTLRFHSLIGSKGRPKTLGGLSVFDERLSVVRRSSTRCISNSASPER